MSVWYEPSRDRWRYKFRLGGKPHQGVCVDPATGSMARNMTEARRVERVKRQEAEDEARQAKVAAKVVVPAGYTLHEAMSAYGTRQVGKAGWVNQRVYVRELLRHFGKETQITALSDARIWDYIEWSRAQPILIFVGGPTGNPKDPSQWRPRKDDRKRQDSTINRYLDCLGKACRIAYEARNEKGERLVPFVPNIPNLGEPDMMPNPVPDDVIRSLLQHAPQHLAEAVALTMLMGFRKGEACTLTRRQIDHQNHGIRLSFRTTKGQRDEFIRANSTAWRLLQYLDAQAEARGVAFLIARAVRTDGGGIERRMVGGVNHRSLPAGATFEWQPVKNPKRAWTTEMKRQGVAYRFHDLKGSFSSGLAPKVSGKAVQHLSRHADGRTTDRYIGFADATLRDAVETIAHRPAVAGIDMGQPLGRSKAAEGKSRSPGVAPEGAPLPMDLDNILKRLVGATGFEPATSSPPDFGSSNDPLISFKKIANER